MEQRVLLVEDDRYLIKIYSNKLAQAGFLVDMAITAEEALRKIATTTPDIILLDLILPGKDGFEFLEELRKMMGEKSKIPVIILSNLGQDIDRERAKELGAVDYLIKTNVSLSEIIERVKKLTTHD